MFDFAGLTVSAINLALNFHRAYRDWGSWQEADVQVDFDWLDVALKKGLIVTRAAG
jgi:hypothetical protein